MKKWWWFICPFLFAATAWLLASRINAPRPEIDAKLRASGARKALEMLTHARAYPSPNVANAGLMSAFEASNQSLVQPAGVATPSWRPIGPLNIGGRTLAIAIDPQHPDTVYAGSASGGLWRSDSGGCGPDAWQRVSTGFPVLGVSSVAIDPNDTDVIYIGTGEVYGSPETFPGISGQRLTRGSYGIGILKTTDGGQTWAKSLDWTFDQQRGVQDVRIDPSDSAIVWAATTEGTFQSTDAGATWSRRLDVVMATDIAIDPRDSRTVYVACGGMGSPGHGVYRTRDGGATWQAMNLLRPGFTFEGKAKLAMSPSSPNIVYASVGQSNGEIFADEEAGTWLFKTVDGGDTWRLVSTENYAQLQGWYAHDLAVHPTNPDEIWIGGKPFSAYQSTNGGRTVVSAEALGLFQPAPETTALDLPGSWADYHDVQYHPVDPQIIYFANDGGVFRTRDSGRTVENCSRGYQTTQFYNGTSSSDTDPLLTLGGMQDNSSAAYEGSPDWRRLFLGDGAWTAINQQQNDIIYVSSQFLTLARSNDRGAKFRFLPLRRSIELTNFIAPFILSSADHSTMYAGSNLVYKSTNAGSSWFEVNQGRPLSAEPLIALAGSYQDPNIVYAATSPGKDRGRLFRSSDGGLTWRDVTQTLPDRFPTDLAVDWTSDLVVYVTFGGFGSSHVFKSTDGGDTWFDIGEGLPDLPTWSVIVDPDFPDQLVVGNDLSVYLSQDGGATWTDFSEGLPEAIIAMDLTISRSNRILRVATHGNGFYEIPLPEIR